MTEQLIQENEALKARLTKAAEVFRSQKAQIEQLTNEVKEKTSLAMDYRNQIESLTNALNETKEALAAQPKAADVTIKTSDEEMNRLAEEVSKLKARLDTEVAKNKEVEAAYMQLETKLVESEGKLAGSLEHSELMSKALTESKVTIKALSDENASYKNNNDELSRQLEVYNQKLQATNDTIAILTSDTTTLKAELEKALQSDRDCRKAYDELHTKYEESQKQLEQRIQNLRATENTAAEEAKNFNIERDQWISRCKELEARYNNALKSYTNNMTSLKEENAELKEKIEVITEKEAKTAEYANDMESNVKTLSDKVNDLLANNDQLTNTFDEYKKQVADSDKQLSENVKTIVRTLRQRTGLDYPGLMAEPMMQM